MTLLKKNYYLCDIHVLIVLSARPTVPSSDISILKQKMMQNIVILYYCTMYIFNRKWNDQCAILCEIFILVKSDYI